jgi:hypothetical protein
MEFLFGLIFFLLLFGMFIFGDIAKYHKLHFVDRTREEYKNKKDNKGEINDIQG